MKTKTCHSQGACLALHRCQYCGAPYPFAPGVIQHQPRRWSRTTRISVVRAALMLAVMSVMAALVCLLTGGLL